MQILNQQFKLIPKVTSALLCISLFQNAALASTSHWEIDKSKSSANFSIKHLMFSRVMGSFSDVEGDVYYDPSNISTIKVKGDVSLSSINTGIKKRDNHLLEKDFFDSKLFPRMSFSSKSARTLQNQKSEIVGNLSIKGIEKEVTLLITKLIITEGKDGKRKLLVEATTKLNRKDFGIDNGILSPKASIGNHAQVTLKLVLHETDKVEETNK